MVDVLHLETMRTIRLLTLAGLLIAAALPVAALDYLELDGTVVLVGSTRTDAAPSALLPTRHPFSHEGREPV